VTDLSTTLFKAGEGIAFLESKPLAISFGDSVVVVEPDEIASLPGGQTMMRLIQTGHRRIDEHDRSEYTLYILAGRTHYGDKFQVRALHLTDGIEEAVSVTPVKLAKRREMTEKNLASVLAGKYPAAPDATTCPRCPHFFICPELPNGSLVLGAK
jgi:DNA helicase-2/ATP-dependent DNA helicase PcrA